MPSQAVQKESGRIPKINAVTVSTYWYFITLQTYRREKIICKRHVSRPSGFELGEVRDAVPNEIFQKKQSDSRDFPP
jgi:hypothetical protein